MTVTQTGGGQTVNMVVQGITQSQTPAMVAQNVGAAQTVNMQLG